MELKFEKSEINCYREIFCGCTRSEEMSECVVPDICPDIGSIIDVSAQVLIRSKEAALGRVTVECTVKCTALYLAEGDSNIYKLENDIPMTILTEVPEADEHTEIKAALYIEDAEVRLINSRKILSKAEVCLQLQCFVPDKMLIDCKPEDNSNVLLLQKCCSSVPVVDVKEKTFVISDELSIPAAGYDRVLKKEAQVFAEDVKFIGKKLVFKGEAQIQVLLDSSENPKPEVISHSMSFSQIIELDTDADSAQMGLCLTGFYATLEETEQRLNIEMHILAQAVAAAAREIEYISDAYSNSMNYSVSTCSVALPQAESCSQLRESVRSMIETPYAVRELLFTSVQCALPRIAKDGLSGRISLRCVFMDDAGIMRSASKKESYRFDAEVCSDSIVTLKCGEAYAAAASGGIDVRLPVEINLTSRSELAIKAVDGMELQAPEGKMQRPSMYIVPTPVNVDMWALAKKYHSTVELIEECNPEPDNVLLIPVQN